MGGFKGANIKFKNDRTVLFTMDKEQKAGFIKVYANLPLDLRREIILIVREGNEDKPITWNVAFSEISSQTALGEKILKKIVDLGLI